MSEIDPHEVLTPREKEVLCLIAEGDSLLEIAQKLHRSQKTIESHRLSIGRKLSASNRVELTKIAIASGLVSLESHGGESRSPDALRAQMAEQELAWLEQINDAVYNATGRRFLQRFCRAASTLPGIHAAAICTTDTTVPPGENPMNRVVMACAVGGEDRETFRYCAQKTPCHEIINAGECMYVEGVARAYPDDPWLQQLNAESYFGIQLIDEDNMPVGGIALIGQEPMRQTAAIRRVLEFFVPRLAAVVRTCLEIDALQTLNSELSSQRPVIDPAAIPTRGAVLQDRQTAEALAQITRRVRALAGVGFLRGLIDTIAEVFGTEYVGVCEIDQDEPNKTLQSRFFREKLGHGDPFKYLAVGTPCEDVLSHGAVCVQANVCEKYPGDAFFIEHKIESYIGLRLDNPDANSAESGGALGVMWLLDRRRLDEPKAIVDVLTYFAPRIAAELEQVRRIDALLQQQEALEQKLSLIQRPD